MKKARVFVALALILTCLIALTACAGTPSGDRRSVPVETARRVTYDMTHQDVVDLIGFDGIDVGSGPVIHEYLLDNGERMQISYVSPSGYTGTDWRIVSIRIGEETVEKESRP